jgi:hypothetical protein
MIGFLKFTAGAKYIGRSDRWLREHYHEIPHYRPPGGQILFDVADLKAWMSRFRVEPKEVDISGLVNRVVRSPRRRGREGRFSGGEGA